jgi:hypothetical protein
VGLTQLKVDRLSLVSDRPFATGLAAIRTGIGQPDMNKLEPEFDELVRCLLHAQWDIFGIPTRLRFSPECRVRL